MSVHGLTLRLRQTCYPFQSLDLVKMTGVAYLLVNCYPIGFLHRFLAAPLVGNVSMNI